MNFIKRLVKREDGQTMIEYPLIIALISLAAIVALTASGVSVNDIFTNVANTLAAAP